jgi:hypothetical protein
MRNLPTTPDAATTASLQARGRIDAPAELVCMALALAVLVLLCRIAAVW